MDFVIYSVLLILFLTSTTRSLFLQVIVSHSIVFISRETFLVWVPRSQQHLKFSHRQLRRLGPVEAEMATCRADVVEGLKFCRPSSGFMSL